MRVGGGVFYVESRIVIWAAYILKFRRTVVISSYPILLFLIYMLSLYVGGGGRVTNNEKHQKQ